MASVDTNILLRYLLNDHADHSVRATNLFQSVRAGDIEVYCPATVVFESVHILLRNLEIGRSEIAQVLTELISYQGFRLEHHQAVVDALAFWVDQPALDFADCYHLAVTAEMGMSRIFTFDKKMDRYPGVKRVEPA